VGHTADFGVRRRAVKKIADPIPAAPKAARVTHRPKLLDARVNRTSLVAGYCLATSGVFVQRRSQYRSAHPR
jgi:hypothetical protein